MTVEEIQKLVQEVIEEMNVTGAVGGYLMPLTSAKPGQGKNKATLEAEKLGYKIVKRPEHPSHTKMFDYLDEKKK